MSRRIVCRCPACTRTTRREAVVDWTLIGVGLLLVLVCFAMLSGR